MNLEIINFIGHCVNLLENNINIFKFFIIKDKIKTKQLLSSFNYPVTVSIDRHRIKESDYVVCKPYNGKEGKGIYFYKPGISVPSRYLNDKNYFFEKFEIGKHYRIILYKNKIITIFERIIPTVIGDGKHTVNQLVDTINRHRLKINKIVLHIDDINYIPELNEIIQCNNMCNFSTGGTVKTICIDFVPFKTRELFEQLSKDIQLNFFSIDLISTDIKLDIAKQKTFVINELEYCFDWDVNYILKDEHYFLGNYLILKWILYFIIIERLVHFYNKKKLKKLLNFYNKKYIKKLFK